MASNSAEGGASGVTVTTGNSGGLSGNAFTSVSIDAGAAAVFGNTTAAHGGLSYALNAPAGTAIHLKLGTFSALTFALRFYVNITGVPPSAMAICNVMDTTGATFATIAINSVGGFVLQDKNGGLGSTNTQVTPQLNTWYRIEVQGTIATTTTGQVTMNLYRGDETTSRASVTSSTANLGTLGFGTLQFGKSTPAVAYNSTYYLDGLAGVDGTTTPIGPAVAGYKEFIAEGITTDGVALSGTVGGAGSGDPVTIPAGIGGSVSGTATKPSEVIFGNQSLKLVAVANQPTYVRWSESALPAVSFRAYYRLSEIMSDSAIHTVTTGSSTTAAKVVLTASDTLAVMDGSTTLYTTPSALTLPGVYGIDLAVAQGTSTTNGKIKFAVYDASGNLAAGMAAPYENTACNTLTGGLTYLNAGKSEADAASLIMMVDAMRRVDTYALVGPQAAMDTKSFSAEGVPTDGTAITASNQGGSGDTLSTAADTGTSITGTAVNGEVIDGQASLKISSPSGAYSYVGWDLSAASGAGLRAYARLSSTAGYTVMMLCNAAGSVAKAIINGDGTVSIQDAASTVLYTTPSALTLPGVYGIDLAAEKGTTTTNGRIKFAAYDSGGNLAGGMTSLVEFLTCNTGTADFTATIGARVGKVEASATAVSSLIVDDLAMIDAYQLLGSQALSPPASSTPTLSYIKSGTAVESVATGGVSNLTVPSGIVTTDTVLIQIAGSTPAPTSITVTKAGATFSAIVPLRTDGNMFDAVYKGTGVAAGDTIAVTFSSNLRLVSHHYFKNDLAAPGMIGSRGGVSQTTVTAPSMAITANTPVYAVVTERANGATFSSVTNTGGNALSTLHTDYSTTSGTYSGTLLVGMIPTTTATGDTTATTTVASGNAMAFHIAEIPATVATPTATVAMVSGFGADYLRGGWVLSAGTSARLVLSASADLSSPTYSTAVTIPTSGWVTVKQSGLSAGTTYYMGIEVDGTLLTDGRLSATTATIGPLSYVALTGSCQYTGSNHVVFDQMASENAAFFAHQGDLHYGDTTVAATWRDDFVASMSASKMKAFAANLPMNYVYDNHDWAGQGGYGASWAADVNPATMVRELAGSDDYPATTTNELYTTWVHGRVRWIKLDQWSTRSPDTDPDTDSKYMISPEQEQWFYDTLSSATEPLIILLSSWPMYHSLAGGRWGSYPNQVGRMKAWLTARPDLLKRMVAIGGDSHAVHADSGVNQDALGTMPTLNASPLNQAGGLPAGTWDIGNLDVDNSRGYYSRVTINDNGADVNFTWDAVQDDGTVMMTYSQTFDGTVLQASSIQFVGQASGNTYGTSLTVGYSSTISNTLIALVQHQGQASATISDNVGNDWTLATTTGGLNPDIAVEGDVSIFYATNTTAITSVTVTPPASGGISVTITEWRGVGSVHDTAFASLPATLGSAARTVPVAADAGDLVIGLMGYYNSGTRVDPPPAVLDAAYTALDNNGATTTYIANAYRVVAVNGTAGPTWTGLTSANTGGAATVSFSPSVAPPATMFKETFDTIPPGQAITTDNSHFDTIDLQTSSTFVAIDDGAHHGNAGRMTSTTAGLTAVRNLAVVANELFVRFYVRLAALPPTAMGIYAVTASGTNLAKLQISSTGTVTVYDGTSAVAQTTTALTAGEWARLEWHWNAGADTQTLQLYTGTSVEAAAGSYTEQVSGTAATTGASATSIGILDATASMQVDIDSVEINSTTWVGPVAQPPPQIRFIGQAINRIYALSLTTNYTSTAGNTLIVMIEHQGRTIASITDDGGNTYTLAATNVSYYPDTMTGEGVCSIYYCLNAAAMTAVTVTVNTSSGNIQVNVSEWSGVASLGNTAAGTINSSVGSAPRTFPVSAAAGGLVVGIMGYYNSGTHLDPPLDKLSAGYVAMPLSSGGASTYISTAYDITTAAGSTGPAWTGLTSTNRGGGVTAAFTSIGPSITIWDGTAEVAVTLTIWDGTNEVAATLDLNE